MMSASGAKCVKYYFDCISPYAWLAWRPLNAIAIKNNIEVVPVPVVFAGLLNANGQLGPAEIPHKRMFLIKDVMRRAATQNLVFNVPEYHPFNPLVSLRVASLDMPNETRINLTGRLLDAVWMRGENISDPSVVAAVASSVGLDGEWCVQQARDSVELKERLRRQTNDAVAAGVFGVPTTGVGVELFWGSEMDTMEHIGAAIQGIDPVDRDLLEKWKNIQPGAVRRRPPAN
jgi:2-hydroxychromene-2-carboxylate isomerase